MGKILFFIIIILAVYFLFFKRNQVKEEKNSEELIMCDNCKTFVPQNEIKKIEGKNICKECYDNIK